MIIRGHWSTVVLAAICWLGEIATAPAQQLPQAVIGVIDFQGILRQSQAAKGIQPEIKKLREKFQASVQSQGRNFRATEQELTRQRSLLSPEAYAQKRKEFQLRAREAQRNVQERKRSIDRMLGMAMNKISKALLEIVAAMARERSINIVLQRALVVYAPRQFDISAEVLRRLNKQLPSVALQMPVAK